MEVQPPLEPGLPGGIGSLRVSGVPLTENLPAPVAIAAGGVVYRSGSIRGVLPELVENR
jgi:hypothetical protein